MKSYKIQQFAALLIILVTQAVVAGISAIQEGENLKVEIDGEHFENYLYADTARRGNCERYMSGEKIENRLVNKGDFEKVKPQTVLALGDSITAGSDGPSYRQFLAPELAKLGLSFIGPRHDDYTAHAGYGGRSSSFLFDKIDEIYRKHPADYVLLHSGHNHFAKDEPVPQILKDTEAIVRAIHDINPKAMVLIAKPIPAGKLPKYSYIPELNRELPALAERLKQEGLPVVLVDQATGFDLQTDTLADKVHPNTEGALKMAERWFEALEPLTKEN